MRGAAVKGPGARRPPPPPLSFPVRPPTPGATAEGDQDGLERGPKPRRPQAGHCSPDRACASEPGAQGTGPPATTTG